MALTEKRKRELDAVLDLSPGSSQREPIQVGTDEDKLARLNAMAADRGEEPISLESLQAAQNVGKPLPEPPTKEKAAHLFGSWGGGLLDIADMPYHISQAKEAVGGWIDKKAPGVRDIYNMHPVEMGKDWLFEQMEPGVLTGDVPATSVVPGLKQAREYSEELKLTPEQLELAPGTAMAGKGMEWLGVPGISTGVGLTKSAIKGGTDALKQALPDAGKQLAREAKVAGSMSTGAGLGSGLGQATDREEWGMFGELVGGVTGLVAALKTGKAANLSAAQEKMLNKLMEKFESPQEAIAALEEAVAKGEIGTLLDLTGSRSIANVEAQLMNTDTGNTAISQKLEDRINQIYEETTKTVRGDVPEGTNPESSAARAKTAVEAESARIENEGVARLTQAVEETKTEAERLSGEISEVETAATDARTAADQAEQDFVVAGAEADPGRTTVEISESATERLRRAEAATKARKENPAWNKFDNGPDVNTIPMREAMDEYLRTLTPQARKQLLATYPDLKGVVGKWPESVNPADVTDVIQDFKAAINEAAVSGTGGTRHTTRLGELVDLMESALERTNGNYRDAVAATKDRYDRFGGRVGRAVEGEEPEITIGTLGTQGDQGAATVRQMEEARVPTASRDIYDYILAEATRKGEDITPQFLKSYEGAVNRMPEADRLKLERLVETKQTKDSALSQATAAETAADRTAKTNTTKLEGLPGALEIEKGKIGAETVGLVNANKGTVLAAYGKGDTQADELVKDLLTRPDGVENLRELQKGLLEMDEAQGMGAQVMPSFQARVNKQVQAQLFDVFTDSKIPLKDALKNFRKMRKRLVDEGLMDAEHADYVDELLRRMETETLRKQGKAAVGNITDAGNENTNLGSSILSSLLLAPLPGGYNLQLGGAARRYFKSGLEVQPTKRNIAALTEYITNPKAFLEGIEKLDSPAAKERFFLSKLLGAAQAAEMIGGE